MRQYYAKSTAALVTLLATVLLFSSCAKDPGLVGSWYSNYEAERQFRASHGGLSVTETAVKELASKSKNVPSLIVKDQTSGVFITVPVKIQPEGNDAYTISAIGDDELLRMTLGPKNAPNGWKMNQNSKGQLIIEFPTDAVILERR